MKAGVHLQPLLVQLQLVCKVMGLSRKVGMLWHVRL